MQPSYLPWSQNTNIVPGSCEAYFGNGFIRRVDLLPHSSSTGWFRCFYSETLRSSICEGGKMRMVPERIKMSKGGEKLEEVMRRREEEEMPEFQDGAFEGLVGRGSRKSSRLVLKEFLDKYVPQGRINPHTMRELLQSVRVTEEELQCDEWIEEPMLLVTRFEYANVFHTATDSATRGFCR